MLEVGFDPLTNPYIKLVVMAFLLDAQGSHVCNATGPSVSVKKNSRGSVSGIRRMRTSLSIFEQGITHGAVSWTIWLKLVLSKVVIMDHDWSRMKAKHRRNYKAFNIFRGVTWGCLQRSGLVSNLTDIYANKHIRKVMLVGKMIKLNTAKFANCFYIKGQ